MNLCIQFSLTEIVVVAFHEEAAGLLVQCTFRERHNQEASNNLQDVADIPLLRVPVLFESVHADLTTRLSHVWVENLGQKVTLRWLLREISVDLESTPEYAIMERCVHCE